MSPAWAVALLAGTEMCFLPAAPAQTASQTPKARSAQAGSVRNAALGKRYVGSKVCGACHPRIFSSYIKTGMGRSVVAGEDKSLVDRLPVPFAVFDQKTGLSFEIS